MGNGSKDWIMSSELFFLSSVWALGFLSDERVICLVLIGGLPLSSEELVHGACLWMPLPLDVLGAPRTLM